MNQTIFAPLCMWGLTLGPGCETNPTGSDSGPSDSVISDSAASFDSGHVADAGLSREDSSSPDDATLDAAVREFECTHVIGFSQTNQWYSAGATVFESLVDDDRWQLRWNGGAGVDRWRDPGYTGWDNPVVSPCPTRSDDPDRVLLTISGPYGDDEAAWAEAIRDTITVIRGKHVSVREIVLQAVVGGPGHADCPAMGGGRVRASWQHAHIDNAIAQVVGLDVVTGFSPEVLTCDEYRDSTGHLTTAGAEGAASRIGGFYASF